MKRRGSKRAWLRQLTNASMAAVLGLEPDAVDRVVAAAQWSLAEGFENDCEEVCHE